MAPRLDEGCFHTPFMEGQAWGGGGQIKCLLPVLPFLVEASALPVTQANSKQTGLSLIPHHKLSDNQFPDTHKERGLWLPPQHEQPGGGGGGESLGIGLKPLAGHSSTEMLRVSLDSTSGLDKPEFLHEVQTSELFQHPALPLRIRPCYQCKCVKAAVPHTQVGLNKNVLQPEGGNPGGTASHPIRPSRLSTHALPTARKLSCASPLERNRP